MDSGLKRADLDRLASHYSLDAAASDTLLDLAGARPSRTESLTFLARCFRYAGVLSLGASVVFFVAANWSKIAVFGRFGILELLLILFVAIGLYKPPPRFLGRAATLLAFITTGALLALFGQTYQTGADVYELFLSWALLGLPLAVAAQWGVATAAWVLVLDLALGIFCGWTPRNGIFWSMFESDQFAATHALLFAATLNLAGWFVFERLDLRAVPEWVRKLILFFGFVFVTWLGDARGLYRRSNEPRRRAHRRGLARDRGLARRHRRDLLHRPAPAARHLSTGPRARQFHRHRIVLDHALDVVDERRRLLPGGTLAHRGVDARQPLAAAISRASGGWQAHERGGVDRRIARARDHPR